MTEDDMVLVKVFRYNPDSDEKPGFEQYEVPRGDRIRVLDFLKYIYEELDPTLSYRRHLCDVRLCNGCLMRVNQRNCLVCWEKVGKDQKEIVIEPVNGYEIVKDLVVDFGQKRIGES